MINDELGTVIVRASRVFGVGETAVSGGERSKGDFGWLRYSFFLYVIPKGSNSIDLFLLIFRRVLEVTRNVGYRVEENFNSKGSERERSRTECIDFQFSEIPVVMFYLTRALYHLLFKPENRYSGSYTCYLLATRAS